MKWMPLALGWVGCVAAGGGGGPVQPVQPTPGGAGECGALVGYTAGSVTTFTASALQVNGIPQNLNFNGAVGCVSTAGNGAMWRIPDTNGDLALVIVNEAMATGNLDVGQQTLSFDFPLQQPALTFSGTEFFSANYQVTSLSPFQVDFSGTATDMAGNNLLIAYLGSVTP